MNVAQSSYLKVIEQEMSGMGQLTPIDSGSLGDFPWFWENENGDFNENTFNYINSRVAPEVGDTQIAQLVSPFDNDYLQILNNVSFQLSVADTNRLNGAAINAGVYGTRVVSAYQTTFGPITPDDWKEAGVTTSIDYIINYVVGALWSGRKQHSLPAFTVEYLVNQTNLASALPDMPASGYTVLPLIESYLNNIKIILTLGGLSGGQNKPLANLKTNTEHPTLNNGGMETRDSNGNDACHVGYTISPTPGCIQDSLSTRKKSITIQISTTQLDQGLLSVQINSVGSGTVPSEGLIIFQNQKGEVFNPHTLPGSEKNVNLMLTYQGCTLVCYGPRLFEEDTGKGWYSVQAIAQAVANTGKDVTGYRFISNQNIYNFAQGGNFGIVSKLLIANYPTINLDIPTGSYADFNSAFTQPNEWQLTLFGLPLGTTSLYKSIAQKSSTSEGFNVTFSPSTNSISIPDFDERACVLGGQILYPVAQT